MADIDVLAELRHYFEDPQLTKVHSIQSLWSGYGEIARYQSPKINASIIIKNICPPAEVNHPRGWNTQSSHQRKLQSYQVEGHFYREYAPQCDNHCKVPSLATEFIEQSQQVLVLEDLDSLGFSVRKSTASIEETKRCIKWLAYFHARFLQSDAELLWPIGTYWHLSTRQDEFDVMVDSSLKRNAARIDKQLNQARFQTLVHGDAKLANFCFSDQSSKDDVAAVDFQYVGRSVGVKDVAYLLGACLSEDALFESESSLLAEYFFQINKAVRHYQIDIDTIQLEQEWRALYPLAWADFHRFLLGWSPEHFKINTYMQKQTELALVQLV